MSIFLCPRRLFFFVEHVAHDRVSLEEVFVFSLIGSAHASGESLVVLSPWLSLVVSSRGLFEACLVFSGCPPLG